LSLKSDWLIEMSLQCQQRCCTWWNHVPWLMGCWL